MPLISFSHDEDLILDPWFREFRDRRLEGEFHKVQFPTMVRRAKVASLLILFAVPSFGFLDYFELGLGTGFFLLLASRGIEFLLAITILIYGHRANERELFWILFFLGLVILSETLLQVRYYSGGLVSVMLQQALMTVFALIFYPLTLRVSVPAILIYNLLIFGQIGLLDATPVDDRYHLGLWLAVGLLVGLYTARQLNAANRKNYLEMRRRDLQEAELRESRTEAELANRTKSEFLANMSHELRTPLNAIIGFSEMMQHHVHGPLGSTRYDEYAVDIAESGRHLMSLIDDVLDLSKIEAGAHELVLEAVDLRPIAASAIRLMSQQTRAQDLSVTLETECGVCIVCGDPRALRQILLNLLGNAIKFTESGGRVVARIICQDDGSMVLSIIDTGVGIPKEKIETILRPFEQADHSSVRREKGWGLGLAIVKALVDMHNAEMTIDSTVGKGTTVNIHFPPCDINAVRNDDDTGVATDQKWRYGTG